MTYPILKPKDTWFDGSIDKSLIHNIHINGPQPLQYQKKWDAGTTPGEITAYVTNDGNLFLNSDSPKIFLNEDSAGVFSLFSNVTSYFGLNFLDTSNVLDFSKGFFKNEKLTALDLSSWNMGSCTTLLGAFGRCYALTSLNVSNWNTSSCTNMTQVFVLCTSLKKVDVSSWNVSHVQNFSGMFMGQKQSINALEDVGDLSNWDVRQATTVQSMFQYSNIKNIKIKNWNLASCKNASVFAGGTSLLTTVDMENIKFGITCTLKLAFAESGLVSINAKNISMVNPIDCTGMFTKNPNLQSVIMDRMLISNANGMFQNVPSLINLNVVNWDMSQCTDLSFMFWGCSKLTALSFENWDVSKVTTMDHFLAHDLELSDYDVSKWKTPSLINANAVFHSTKPAVLDVSGWDTSKVQHFAQMFEGVGINRGGTKIIGLENFNTSNGLSFNEMFHLTSTDTLDLSNFDTRKAKNDVVQSNNNGVSTCMKDMFLDAVVNKIIIGPNFSINGDGTNTLEENKAVFPTSTMWYTIHGEEFTPQEAPKQSGTYYNGRTEIDEIPVIIRQGDLIDIANAIRKTKGITKRMLPSEMATEILAK